jgi:hypothetical protein
VLFAGCGAPRGGIAKDAEDAGICRTAARIRVAPLEVPIAADARVDAALNQLLRAGLTGLFASGLAGCTNHELF